jgi:hypothetical protein
VLDARVPAWSNRSWQQKNGLAPIAKFSPADGARMCASPNVSPVNGTLDRYALTTDKNDIFA